MTSLTINLSSELQSTLGKQGVYAYAVYFDSSTSTNPQGVVLVDNGAVLSGGTTNFTPAQPYGGLKVYFVIQSTSAGAGNLFTTSGGAVTGGGLVTSQSQMTWTSATAEDFRFDSFEVSLLATPGNPSAGDSGNLTEINGFGIPMEVSVTYDGGNTQTRGYAINGSAIFQAISGVSPNLDSFPYTAGPLSGSDRMALSPAEAEAQKLPGANYTDWAGYVTGLESIASQIQIPGYFNGAPSVTNFNIGTVTYANYVYHNPGFYNYGLSWDGTNFYLTPAANSQIKGTIQIDPTNLENSIYATIGSANILVSSGGATYLPDMNTGANNQWGAAFVKFLTGFTAGYWGGTAQSLNPQLGPATIDLSKDWNFDPTYAFGGTSGGPVVTPFSSVFYDRYAELFFSSSNAYGNGYSDALMNAYTQGGPLINVANSDGSDVPNINITMFDDNETNPSTTQGYVIPTIDNVNLGPYVAPLTGVSSNLSMTLDFSGLLQVTLGADVSASLNFYTSTTGTGSNSVAHFSSMQFASGGAPTTGVPLMQTWNFTSDGFTQEGTPAPTGAVLQVDNLPYATGVNWYQLVIANATTSQTYDFYLTASGGMGVENPFYRDPTGATPQSGAIALDHLAALPGSYVSSSTQQYYTSVNIGLMPGGTVTMDPSLLGLITDPAIITAPSNSGIWQIPTAPILGRSNAVGGFAGMFLPTSGGSAAPPQTIATDTFYLGWAGADSAAMIAEAINTIYPVKAYTNKVNALDVATLTITSGGSVVSTVSAVSDLDGNWVTSAPVSLGAGTYSVTMQEYDPTGTFVRGPVGSAQVFTVAPQVVNNNVTLGGGQTSAGLTVVAGGTLTVNAGGTAIATLVTGGSEGVSGGVDSGVSVVAGGSLVVAAGGSSIDAVIGSGGSATISAGGIMTLATVASGGVDIISAGGATTATQVSSGSTEIVAGGLGFATTVSSGGSAIVSGGSWTYGTVLSGGTAILSGGTTSSATVSGGSAVVLAGAVVSTVSVGGGGVVTVSNGAVGNYAYVLSGGEQIVLSGGIDSNTQAIGGAEIVSGGGVAVNTTLQTHSLQLLSGGAVASNTTVQSGSEQIVSAGALASTTTVQNSARLDVLSDGVAFAPTIESGGREIVFSGGVVSGATIQNSGTLELRGGAVIAGAPVFQSGAIEEIASGYQLPGQIVSSAFTLVVGPGGTASGAMVQGGGTETVLARGKTSTTVISGGGIEIVSSGGIARNTVVLSGGTIVIRQGGKAPGLVVSAGGIVSSGGSDADITISNGQTSTGLTVTSGSTLTVLSGGVAIQTNILSSGTEEISGGHTTSTTVRKGAIEHINSGGVASSTVVLAGGNEHVLAGGLAQQTILSGGTLRVSAGGMASGAVVSNSGNEYVSSGGIALATVVSSGGSEYVYGQVSNTVVSGGRERVSAGGSAVSTTVASNGTTLVYAGGSALGTLVGSAGNLRVSSGGIASSATISNGGRVLVLANGIDSAAVVLSGGTEYVSSGGQATGTILSGGAQRVSTGASALGTMVGSNATLYVYGGGSAVGALVGPHGTLKVSSGGVASSALIGGGSEYVSSGGSIVGATLSGGVLEILSGGTAGASTVVISSGTLKLDNSQNFNGYISGLATGAQVVDLVDINFATVTLVYSGTTVSGVLTAQDGASHVAQLHLIGDYINAHFTSANDGHGGTLVTDPPVSTAQGYVVSH